MRLTGRITGPRKPVVGAYAAMLVSLLSRSLEATGETPSDVRLWPGLLADGRRVRLEAARLGIGEDEVRVRELMAASVMDPVVA
jgi:hypothetical protein